jgi:hypothetical protein
LDEAFFSIDEFGPFAVKMKQGQESPAYGVPDEILAAWNASPRTGK